MKHFRISKKSDINVFCVLVVFIDAILKEHRFARASPPSPTYSPIYAVVLFIILWYMLIQDSFQDNTKPRFGNENIYPCTSRIPEIPARESVVKVKGQTFQSYDRAALQRWCFWVTWYIEQISVVIQSEIFLSTLSLLAAMRNFQEICIYYVYMYISYMFIFCILTCHKHTIETIYWLIYKYNICFL